MRTYILSKIGNKREEEMISWGNERVNKDLKISSLKDKVLVIHYILLILCNPFHQLL